MLALDNEPVISGDEILLEEFSANMSPTVPKITVVTNNPQTTKYSTMPRRKTSG